MSERPADFKLAEKLIKHALEGLRRSNMEALEKKMREQKRK